MRKKILYTLLTILAVFVTYAAYVINNPVSPLETVSSDDSDVSITYSRPFKNDRLIFGNESDEALVPYDNYWRTGANRHTYIENNRDLSIDGNTLFPGKYSIYTIPGENEWEVFFNSNVNYLWKFISLSRSSFSCFSSLLQFPFIFFNRSFVMSKSF